MSQLLIILPSEASMIKNEEFGLLPRWIRMIDEYKLYFNKIEIYTCDKKDYSEKLGVPHHPCRILIDAKYLKAITYNIWLLFKIPFVKTDIIRFFGSVYPLMPLFSLLNKTPRILSYQYDFSKSTSLDFGNFKGRIASIAEKFSVLYAGNILTTTNELQKVLNDRYNLHSWVNPNFVDLNTFHPQEKEEHFLFYAGRIVYSKGIDDLIRMIRHFNEKGLHLQLILAGDGDVSHYRSVVSNENLEDQITFLGPVSSLKVAELMRSCEVFVFPPLTREGHPKSLIEALASGSACVATRVPGNLEVIEDRKNGILAEPGNLEDLMDKVGLLLGNDVLRKEIKREAVLSARKYDIKTVVSREVEIINSIILARN
jgi:glycosyltransferase involved in cell wall biosynthesis